MFLRIPSRKSLGMLALLFTFSSLSGSLWLEQNLFLSPAVADDDGGGDDGDDGGGGGGGPTARASGGGGGGFMNQRKRSTYKKVQRAKQKVVRAKRARAPVRQREAAKPFAAPDEVILRGISTKDLVALEERGFKAKAKRIGPNGLLVVKLGIPPKVSLRRARDLARQLAPGATVDFNHYFRNGYRVQSGGQCKGEACKPFALVGWRAQFTSCAGLPEIGLIDTKVDIAHPSLAAAKIDTLKLEGQTAEGSDAGHGTAVAALIAGQPASATPGLLPQVRLVSVDVFESSRRGDERADAFALASAIDALRGRGVKVINMSLAGPENEVLASAVVDASKAGSVLVSAAGNAGPSAAPAYPAAYDSVIAVTAVSDGLSVYRRAGRGPHIDIAAPGVRIPTAGRTKDVEVFTGSSFAVPFVSAAVAVQLSRNAGWNITQSASALKQGAKDLGKPGPDPVFGAGLLQFTPCT